MQLLRLRCERTFSDTEGDPASQGVWGQSRQVPELRVGVMHFLGKKCLGAWERDRIVSVCAREERLSLAEAPGAWLLSALPVSLVLPAGRVQ